MASTPDRDRVIAALSAVIDPSTGRDVVSAGLIQGLSVREGRVGFMLEAKSRSEATRLETVRAAAERAVAALPGVTQVMAVLTAEGTGAPAPPQQVRIEDGQVRPRPPGPPQPEPRAAQRLSLPGVKHIIAVASGKGGVGKSTVAANLALGLSRLGRRTGLLDADIYGPSVPHLFGLTERPRSLDGKKLDVIRKFGLELMSIGLLVDIDTPMIWRGPMVMSALSQMLGDVNWGALDVLVVDMPPGTGDAQLTMAQRVPLSGAVIVSTPQDIALIDARKGLAMFRKTEVPVFGIVENMSVFVCPACGHESHIFGHGGARETAAKLACDFLGEIPLHMAIRETSDGGAPIMASAPDSPQALALLRVAEQVAARLDSGFGAKPPPVISFVD
jgi:ATP-binding protein involved in chromosome partitioning